MERTRLHAVGGGLVKRVERESRLSWKGEVLDGVRGELLERILRGPSRRLGCRRGQKGQLCSAIHASEAPQCSALSSLPLLHLSGSPDRSTAQHVPSSLLRLTLSNLGQAVADKEDEVDENPVCWSLDLKVAEERVGTEQVERLCDDVVSFEVGCHSAAGQRRVSRASGICCSRLRAWRRSRTANLGREGEEGHVADEAVFLLVVVARVVGL